VPGFDHWVDTLAGRVAVVSGRWRGADHLGAAKVRWGIGREDYRVPPGLYAMGAPDASSPVVVTANYKLTFDLVRRALAGQSLWLLVLETHGINVWCAAGKGTFGTAELSRRLELTGLGDIMQHRELLLPKVGASGVDAAEVKRQAGFRVKFATLRISDLPAYLAAGGHATPAMRELSFDLRERLVLTPVELTGALKLALPGLALVAVLGACFAASWLSGAIRGLAVGLGALVLGTVVTPVLLPWLPTRSFAAKGVIVGGLAVVAYLGLAGLEWHWHDVAAHFLLVPPVVGFCALNFTGSTPFTSRSGVKKEIRRALPLFLASALAGIGAWLSGLLGA
jgi:hypothetical protein